MRNHSFQRLFIQNTWERVPKLTRAHLLMQYGKTAMRLRDVELAYLFSTDINLALTHWPPALLPAKLVYVGFTQDGQWSTRKIKSLSRAFQRHSAITVFSCQERDLYLERYRADPQRMHVIPIHTDEMHEYAPYDQPRPIDHPYVLSLGSPNRKFLPIAQACNELKIPLVIITRPWHRNDSLQELASLGAHIITDADRARSFTYLKHAHMCVMCFATDQLPGAFTTLIHSMFLRTPCIVTRCLGIDEYVIDGQTGFVTPHNDDPALQEAIDHVWRNPELIQQFAQSGYERAQTLYSLHAAAVAHEALAQHVLESSTR